MRIRCVQPRAVEHCTGPTDGEYGTIHAQIALRKPSNVHYRHVKGYHDTEASITTTRPAGAE